MHELPYTEIEMHELPYTEIVKSGTFRLASDHVHCPLSSGYLWSYWQTASSSLLVWFFCVFWLKAVLYECMLNTVCGYGLTLQHSHLNCGRRTEELF